MQFTKYGIYRHKRCLDMDVMITRILDFTDTWVEVEVLYLLQRDHDMVLDKDTVKIHKKEYHNWKEL